MRPNGLLSSFSIPPREKAFLMPPGRAPCPKPAPIALKTRSRLSRERSASSVRGMFGSISLSRRNSPLWRENRTPPPPERPRPRDPLPGGVGARPRLPRYRLPELPHFRLRGSAPFPPAQEPAHGSGSTSGTPPPARALERGIPRKPSLAGRCELLPFTGFPGDSAVSSRRWSHLPPPAASPSVHPAFLPGRRDPVPFRVGSSPRWPARP